MAEKKTPPLSSLPSSTIISLRGEITRVRLIAQGGMSEIFQAYQPSLDRSLVIKKLKDELISDPGIRERFRREAKTLASVLHQNIAHVYDYVETDTEAFILMEYIPGMDLSEVIKKVGGIPPFVAASLFLQITRGVRFIHSRGLIHRDLKPSNIRISDRGEVKLMDFGIALDLQTDSLTRPGVLVGSPFYLSPEQVLGDRVTPQSDIFLLGICFYEMLTGAKPFQDEQNETVFQRIRETKFIPAKEIVPTIPKQLNQLILRCLQKKPEKRFSHVHQISLELESFLAPEKHNQTEIIILQYLEEEALIHSSSSFFEERQFTQKNLFSLEQIPEKLRFFIFSLFLLFILLGIFIGSGLTLWLHTASNSPSPQSIEGYPLPKNTKKNSKGK